MKKLFFMAFILVTFVLLFAHWNPGDPHKMGGAGPQLPDPTGYDINIATNYIGDDWTCGESGPVDQVHFWISFFGDNTGNLGLANIGNITLQIWSDDPIGNDPVVPDLPEPGGEDTDNPYSKPRNILWEGTETWVEELTAAIPGDQGFYDPWEPFVLENNHLFYYQLNLSLISGQVLGNDFIGDPENIPSETDAYYQYMGTTYWLLIHIDQSEVIPTPPLIGWKTSLVHWQDDAVFYDLIDFNVEEIWIPLSQHPILLLNPPYLHPPYETHLDLAFVISGSEATLPVTLSSFDFALTESNTLELKWVTESETDLLGYNLYRNLNETQPETPLNFSVILGQGASSEGHAYSYTDETALPETQYYYWLEAVNLDGSSDNFGPYPVMFEIEDDDDGSSQPDHIIAKVHTVYPNPFGLTSSSRSNCLSIEYSLSSDEASTAKISIYNILGQKVSEIADLESGERKIATWNAKDVKKESLSSGIYFYKFETRTSVKVGKVIFFK